MILISNEGNLIGRNRATEGTSAAIQDAINKGYDCKIYVKEVGGRLYLATREPYERISLNFLIPNRDKLWIQCATVSTLKFFSDKLAEYNFNYFYAAEDCSITSHGTLWWWPSHVTTPTKTSGIVYLPETIRMDTQSMRVGGICCDFIGSFTNDEISN